MTHTLSRSQSHHTTNSRKHRWRDPLLLSAFLIASLLTAIQLAISLLHPPWGWLATNWLRAVAAWPELLAPLLTSLWLIRARRPESLVWIMISAGLLAYALAQNLWVVLDQFVFPNRVPVPWWPDLFFLLQYPFLFLALVFLPGPPARPQLGMTRLKIALDCLLLMAAATALSWYFLLAPLYMHSGQSVLGKVTNLAYPVGDLGVLFGLLLALMRRCPIERVVLTLLIAAVTCLTIADSWFTLVDLHSIYISGGLPDLFWMLCYLLFALAALVQLRCAAAPQQERPVKASTADSTLSNTVIGSFRFLCPFLAALLAGGVIVVRAALAPIGPRSPWAPFAVTFGLLLLVTARQEITFLESEHWRREQEAARVRELAALKEAHQRMDAFLGIASHELKTPLTTLSLTLQLLQQRLKRRQSQEAQPSQEGPRLLPMLTEQHQRMEQQIGRLNRLINELLDVSRIQADRLELSLKLVDLAAIAREAVEEQRQANPARAIELHLPADAAVPLLADAQRVGQVVTNYLTNALKYSAGDRLVEVGLTRERQHARVWVRDQGNGIASSEQERIWERFHRVPGAEVQWGSGIGLGLGLHICKTLIEAHHGHVGIESTPGKGSCFWFTLPLAD
jgi:signal transduction histidine kinase